MKWQIEPVGKVRQQLYFTMTDVVANRVNLQPDIDQREIAAQSSRYDMELTKLTADYEEKLKVMIEEEETGDLNPIREKVLLDKARREFEDRGNAVSDSTRQFLQK